MCCHGNQSALTYIFEGQHNGRNDASHKHHNPKDTEEALALGEVHLGEEKLC